ncbi:Maf family nucleotide pyrophosphatase [Bacteroidota bacterium]
MLKLKYPLILASHSTRRQKLLRDMGFEFTIQTKEIEECYPKEFPVSRVAGYLAEHKARAYEDLNNENIILTADTVVIMDLNILGKPSNIDEARGMIQKLSGNCHEVISAFCISYQGEYYIDDAVTYVFFRDLNNAEIEYYLTHYVPLDKAGSYGIQEWIGMIGIERIEGSFYNVMGLPVLKVYEKMKSLNLLMY